jgi:energy-coupling factor transport system ATP-binding protein
MVLAAVRSLVEKGRSAVIAEHRLDRLLPVARALVTVDAGRVMTGPAQEPAKRQPIAPREARTRIGPVAWSLHGVSAGFGSHVVLEQVDAAGHEGEVVALSGPNGGGKTTLLRLIAGALSPANGKVERRPGRIAYLPQNPTSLLHRPTLRSEVTFTLDRANEDEAPEVILRELGLMAVAERYPRDLSGGERQRAALAAVLPGRPELVLLDEPTRGMDTAARDALIRVASRLRDAGSAIVLATHDADLRAALADRELQVSGGSVTNAEPTKVRV